MHKRDVTTSFSQPNINYQKKNNMKTTTTSAIKSITKGPVVQSSKPQTIQVGRDFAGTKPPNCDFYLTNEKDYRVYLTSDSKRVSPWHKFPLFPLGHDGKKNFTAGEGRMITFVNEIPRGTVAKMEMAKGEAFNPLKQDINKKTGTLRNYPFSSLVNYGFAPQTWEDPSHEETHTTRSLKGDNDPLDVCDLGSPILACGQVTVVKVLGVLGMVDEGEIDWKILAINMLDPRAQNIRTLKDYEQIAPNRIQQLVDWFTQYKIPDGKPKNEFAFEGKARDAEFASLIINETHELYNNLKVKSPEERGDKYWFPQVELKDSSFEKKLKEGENMKKTKAEKIADSSSDSKKAS